MKFNFRKHQFFFEKNIKISKLKISNSQTNNFQTIELHNPDSPSLMEIRRSEVKPYQAPSKIKNILFVFISIFCEE